jgi:hypothetical protein
LSQIGPNASIANEIARLDNIPKAAKDIPNSCSERKDMKIIIPNTNTGNTVDLNPRESPYIMFVAAPVSQDSASS